MENIMKSPRYAEALRRCEALKNASDPAEYERVHYFNAI